MGDKEAGAVRVAGLVEVQPGSVVSREILRRPQGTVTVFAFDEGQGLSEHTAPFDALVIGVEGRFRVVVSGVQHELSAGDMIIMPANQPHAVQSITPFKMLLVMIRS